MKPLLYGFVTIFFLSAPSRAQLETSAEAIERERRFQEEAAKNADTAKVLGWHYGLASGLSLTQVALKDWAPGGEDALSYAASAIGTSEHRAEQTRWTNLLKLTFGQTKVGDQSIRKTDDEIYFESLLIYYAWTKINPYASVTLRTQFAAGYVYNDDGTSTQISKLFDPAYLTQSAGFAYQPSSMLTTRLGVGVREVLASDYPAFADDPATLEIEKSRVQGGLENVTTFDWPFAENMTLSSRLELFAPFKEMDKVIMRSDNIVAAKVNKVVSVTFNVQLINDVNVSARTQIKETLAIGFSYTIL